MIYAHLQWQTALVGDTFTVTNGNTTKKRTSFYLTALSFTSSAVLSCTAPTAVFKDVDLSPGSSIEVKITPEKPSLQSQVTLVAVRASKEQRWAHLPLQTAVCTYVDHTRKLYKCLIPHDQTVNLHFATSPHKLEIGDEIAVGLIIRASKEDSNTPHLKVIYATKPTQPASRSCKQTETTTVETILPSGIAFTYDGIFIPAALTCDQKLKEEQVIEVVAVRNYNKKKDQWGWTAIKVSPVHSNSHSPQDE